MQASEAVTAAPSGVGSARWKIADVALVALPVAAALASVVGQSWEASSDQAFLLLRVGDVGTGHTPLVGVWSRWGWAHPGPALFWVLAPFERGLGPTGLLVGAAAVNLACVVGAVLVAHRRGGPALAGLVALGTAVIVRSASPEMLVDPWNPYIALMPSVLFVLLVWSALCNDPWGLPLAVSVGSFAVQCHVTYLPLVAGLLALAGAWTLVSAWRRGSGSGARRSLLLALLVGAVLWTPALVEELTTEPGNLTLLWQYALDSPEPGAGPGVALEVMGSQLLPAGPWITGDAPPTEDFIQWTSPPAALAMLALAATAATVSRRRGSSVGAALVGVGVVGAALAFLATARITGDVYSYLVLWWWPVALATVAGGLWCVLEAVSSASLDRFVRVGVTVVMSALALSSLAALPAPVPEPRTSRALSVLVDPTVEALEPGRRYLVRGVEQVNWGAAGPGLLAALDRRGVDVAWAESPTAALEVGRHRVEAAGQVDGIVSVVDIEEIDRGWRPSGEARELARFDPLSPVERQELRDLDARIRLAMGPRLPDGPVRVETDAAAREAVLAGADPADVAAMAALRSKGAGYVVVLEPTVG